MRDRDKSKEELIKELASLRREVFELQTIKTAFDTQRQLTKTLITLKQTAKGMLMLKSMLIEIVKTSNQLTEAEESSIFLLDAEGNVWESILARGATIREKKQNVIETVLDRGLAGWVFRERRVGVIPDTANDDRWLTLPSQPYEVRSVLCLPILKGKETIGILTLMHSQPEHFSPENRHLMEIISSQLGLILDQTLLYARDGKPAEKSPKIVKREEEKAVIEEVKDSSFKVGIFIIDEAGNFVYANRKLAEIFGYQFGELVSLESIFSLVVTGQHEFFREQVAQCFQLRSKSLSCQFPGQKHDGNIIDVEVYGNRTKFYNKTVLMAAIRPVVSH